MASHDEAPLLPQERDSEEKIAARVVRKLDRRVLFLCASVVFLAYTDRGNIGYAARDICNDLDLTHEEYGLGVSMFYFGYLIPQLTTNLIVKRIGAPAWLGFIMFVWGVAAAATGFMQNKAQFYILRVLLGIAEGGTFPSIWYFLSLFYPKAHTTGAYAMITSASCLSMPISSPISAGLISLGPAVGVEGWRLLLVVEGLVPVVYALVLYVFLPRDPQSAAFLEREEKDWIAGETQKEDGGVERSFYEDAKIVLSSGACWKLIFTLFINFGLSSVLMFWATLIIHDMLHGDDDGESKTCGSKDGNAALPIILTAIPYLLSGLGCVWVRFTMITNRSRFCAIVNTVGAFALISWVGTREVSFVLGFASLTLSIGMGFINFGPTTALALSLFDNATRPTASAVFNGLACVGGVVFPPIIGKVLDEFGYSVAIPLCGGFLLLAVLLYAFVKDPLAEETKTERFKDAGM